MNSYSARVFVCINKKARGKCCSLFDSEMAYDYLVQQIKNNSLLIENNKRVKVVKTSCLGACAYGPNIFVTPENVWYTFSKTSDLDEIIESHFLKGNIVSHLINKAIAHA